MRAKATQTNEHSQNEACDSRRREIAATPHRKGKYAPLRISMSFRRQTPEEERQFKGAVKLFLSELVRQHMRQESK